VVLERNGNELTLLSMDFAQELTYHNSREAVDWASSDLRAALNGKEYLDAQFSQQEQAMLLPQDTGADGDLVTVPSRAEYLRYQLLMGSKNDLWWLRDTGDAPDTAMFVSDEGEVMAVQHRDFPVYGVQFHPESILTPDGMTMLKNFFQCEKEELCHD
jgi:hypothetical protein